MQSRAPGCLPATSWGPVALTRTASRGAQTEPASSWPKEKERGDWGEGVGWVTLERMACTQDLRGRGSESTHIPRLKGRKRDNQGGVTCPALAVPTFLAPGHTPLWYLPSEKGLSGVNHAEDTSQITNCIVGKSHSKYCFINGLCLDRRGTLEMRMSSWAMT